MGFGLSPAEKVKVSKAKLFTELAPAENDIFNRWVKVVRCAEGKNHRGFRARDRTSYILAATSPNPSNLWPDSVEFRVLLFYLQMICDYVNNYYKLGDTSDPTTRNVPLMATWQNNITNVDDVQGVPAKNSIFTIVADYHLDYEATSTQMTAQLLGPSNFFSVKHIFIPIEYSIIYSRAGEVDIPVIYTTLLVISPQDKTIDWLDPLFSLGEDKIKEIKEYNKAAVILNILCLLSYHLGPLFIPGRRRNRIIMKEDSED
ncbi:hypothetical protein L207DRAFT_578480 [Hyaloscypha variabilis F]|uniref:Uncharacterized protein n=1 Tax=Hyaloscypha variabilis (strain UAMH 11265 / GT02V1 / F) TaxID=1149755 RepID=A0A2J6S487_HYAVF|nr:hypothetical protein L207DRAFT_578480 [Hyaloscypha variabilis F]